MKKMFATALLLAAATLLTAGAAAASIKGDDLRTMKHVSLEMLHSGYWIEMEAGSGKVLMTEEEISSFNKEMLDALPGLLYDLENLPETISGSELAGMIGWKVPEETYYIQGVEAVADYWKALEERSNLAAIAETNEVSYGVVTERSDLKILPTSDFISLDPALLDRDEFQNSGIHLGDPVRILHASLDGSWLFVQNYHYTGWIRAEAVARCSDRQQWLEVLEEQELLVVTGDKIRLEPDPYNPLVSELELSMGTVLRLTRQEPLPATVGGRGLYGNYVVDIPVRDDLGLLRYDTALVPVSRDVSAGYLDYTQANVLDQAFKMLGDRYGWGGMLNSRDASEYINDIYRCFGFRLPRDSGGLSKVPGSQTNLEGLSIGEKEAVLDKTPAGASLHFKGFVMVYLGSADGRYYAISDLGSYAASRESAAAGKEVWVQGVVVSELDTVRANGRTWMEELTLVNHYGGETQGADLAWTVGLILAAAAGITLIVVFLRDRKKSA